MIASIVDSEISISRSGLYVLTYSLSESSIRPARPDSITTGDSLPGCFWSSIWFSPCKDLSVLGAVLQSWLDWPAVRYRLTSAATTLLFIYRASSCLLSWFSSFLISSSRTCNSDFKDCYFDILSGDWVIWGATGRRSFTKSVGNGITLEVSCLSVSGPYSLSVSRFIVN